VIAPESESRDAGRVDAVLRGVRATKAHCSLCVVLRVRLP
jgi:hypothetical protein